VPYQSEPRTYIYLWDVRDRRRIGDPDYWLDGAMTQANGRELRGPKGKTPDEFLADADEDGVPIRRWAHAPYPERVFRIPLDPFRDADPEHTRVFVCHFFPPARPEGLENGAPPSWVWQPDGEHATMDLLVRIAAERERERSDAERGKPGFTSRMYPPNAIELVRGVFLVDERPSAT
jgi:hypothetical protein